MQVSQSLNGRLTRAIVLTTAVSLALACAAIVSYDRGTFREAMTRRAETLAEVVGINSAVALSFLDPDSATQALASLSAVEPVIAAALYDEDGTEFARYTRGGREDAVPALRGSGRRWVEGHMDVRRPVVFGDAPVGTIVIRWDTGEMNERTLSFVGISAALLVASVAVGGLLAARLRGQISGPLAEELRGHRAGRPLGPGPRVHPRRDRRPGPHLQRHDREPERAGRAGEPRHTGRGRGGPAARRERRSPGPPGEASAGCDRGHLGVRGPRRRVHPERERARGRARRIHAGDRGVERRDAGLHHGGGGPHAASRVLDRDHVGRREPGGGEHGRGGLRPRHPESHHGRGGQLGRAAEPVRGARHPQRRGQPRPLRGHQRGGEPRPARRPRDDLRHGGDLDELPEARGDGRAAGGEVRLHRRGAEGHPEHRRGARALTEWLSTSLRLEGRGWDNIDGADPSLNPMMVPTADPNLRAGERLDILFGLNLFAVDGPLAGNRLAVEGGLPIYQRLDGPQLETSWRIQIAWDWTFDSNFHFER